MIFILDITISFLFIFYLYFYFNYTFLSIYILLIFYYMYSNSYNKKKLFLATLLSILYFGYIFYYNYNNTRALQEIQQGHYFCGYITDIEQKEKNYKYEFMIQYYFSSSQKKYGNKKTITLYSKKIIPGYTKIIIPKIYFFQDQNSNLEHSTFHATGMIYFFKLHQYPLYKNNILKIKEILFTIKTSWREKLASLFIRKNDNYNFFQTLFLGKSNEIDNDIKHLFSALGIQHYLARSGLHIAIITDILFVFFLFLGFSTLYITILQMIFLGIFYFLSYCSISFLRAFLMLMLTTIAKITGIKTTSLHVLCATTILVLIFWPFEFLKLATQLTFGTTAILCLIHYQ